MENAFRTLRGWLLMMTIVGSASAQPMCDPIDVGRELGPAGKTCVDSFVQKMKASTPFSDLDCACFSKISSVSDAMKCTPYDGAKDTVYQTHEKCKGIVGQSTLRVVDGEFVVTLPPGKRMIVKSGTQDGVDVEGIPNLIDAAVASTQTAAYGYSDKTQRECLQSSTDTMQTALNQAVGTLRKQMSDQETRLQQKLDRTTSELNVKVAALQKTKAELAAQVKLTKQLQTETLRLDLRINETNKNYRHDGGNLVLASDLQNTKGVWAAPLYDQYAEYDTFIDGLPIRVTTSRELKKADSKGICYPGWGRTNIFEIDPHKTYEFSIWIRSTVHQSRMYNYFGFTLFFANGTALNINTDEDSWRNPYFKSNSQDTSEWTKHYGYLLGADFVSTKISDKESIGAGCTLYGCPKGVNAIKRDRSVFRTMHPLATKALLRFGSCYAENDGNDNTKYTMPMVREIDALRAHEAEKVGHFADRHFTTSNNLVRHSNLIQTDKGVMKNPKYGGDRWVQIPFPELVMFDGFGSPMPIVATRSFEDQGGSCYQGWGLTNYIRINPSLKYEFSIWLRSTDLGMNNYFGFYAYDANYKQLGGLYGNPYFKCSDGDTEEWTRFTGFLVPQSSPGIQDRQCGLKNIGATEVTQPTYRILPQVRYIVLRYGSCYSNGDAKGVSHFAFPSVKSTVGK